jgi:ABC-type phosphate/phosphonate transport system permease subunit
MASKIKYAEEIGECTCTRFQWLTDDMWLAYTWWYVTCIWCMGFQIVARHLLVGSRLPVTRFFFFWQKCSDSKRRQRRGKKTLPHPKEKKPSHPNCYHCPEGVLPIWVTVVTPWVWKTIVINYWVTFVGMVLKWLLCCFCVPEVASQLLTFFFKVCENLAKCEIHKIPKMKWFWMFLIVPSGGKTKKLVQITRFLHFVFSV